METQKKIPFEPEELPAGSPPVLRDVDGSSRWTPMCRHTCAFEKHHFEHVMLNLIKNPNLNSSWLFRADILYDDQEGVPAESEGPPDDTHTQTKAVPLPKSIDGFTQHRTLVRRLIPRNNVRDFPMDQTCSFYYSSDGDEEPAESDSTVTRTLLIYLPHVSSAAELPFYHPKVRGVCHLYEWDSATSSGTVSIHFLLFEDGQVAEADQLKLPRIAYHLLEIVHKHGHSSIVGYVKRVHHDVVVQKTKFQDKYTELKNKYARPLVQNWHEVTDPTKHVFEDLGIASFLIELWGDIYKDKEFPGFVDIGCGNGLLVHILREEGYAGWGFDARERRSWTHYNSSSSNSPSGKSLQRLVLLPSVIPRRAAEEEEQNAISPEDVHDGVFPPGTFIISNHADELTPWTPIIAAISQCPFITIPCCSHNLTGDRYRAPPPRDKTKPKSTFASLVDWVTHIAEDCGWEVETEMLRIPSTRNTGLVGRRQTETLDLDDVPAILQKYGGVEGYYSNVSKLLKSAPRGH